MGMYTVPAWAMLAEQTARTAAAARLFALGLIKSLSPLRLYRHVAGIPNPNTIFVDGLWGHPILFPRAFGEGGACCRGREATPPGDRKSTRLNSSHSQISYAVFCLKKKKQKREIM